MAEKKSNFLVTPTYPNQNNNPESLMNKSSMITYSKIVCCICSALIDANPRGICEACEKKNIDITTGIRKDYVLQYCKMCDRYLFPPWSKCELESQEMMNLCLSRIKGLGKTKIIDSSFIWTEPHSKIIKVKLTIQKELDKILASQNIIVEFRIDWIQCPECKKTFTPHLWYAQVQLRQKVPHKKTFLYLEQLILKHKMEKKAINIEEMPEGVDFFFSSKHDGGVFAEFIASQIPAKIKISKHVVSHSNQQHIFIVDIAPVWKNDLIFLSSSVSKQLGGIGPLVICDRVSSKIRILDPVTFETVELDSNSYFKYEFKSYVDRKCLSEFLIMDIEEEIDYKKKYQGAGNNNNIHTLNEPSMGEESLMSQSTNYKKNVSLITIVTEELTKCKKYLVKCIRNNSENKNVIEMRCHLASKMQPGDIYLGYDLPNINLNYEIDQIIEKNKDKIPEVILIKKKPIDTKENLKLKRLNIESKEVKKKGKKGRENEAEDTEYKEFIEDIMENQELKENVVIDNEKDEDLNDLVDKLDVKEK